MLLMIFLSLNCDNLFFISECVKHHKMTTSNGVLQKKVASEVTAEYSLT